MIVFSGALLKKATEGEVAALVAAVHGAVDSAPDGAIIPASEEAVREAMARFRERVYQKAVQLKADAGASAFSPSGRTGRRRTAWRLPAVRRG